MLTQFPFMCCGHDKKTRQQKLQRLQKLFVHMLPTLHILEKICFQSKKKEILKKKEEKMRRKRWRKEIKREERKKEERKREERKREERREKREERREKERRERDRREKDKEQEENENDESESEEEIPVQFDAMTNQLQICNWLVLHLSVLHLANKMLDASTKQPSTNLPLTTSTSSPSDNDNYLKEFRQIVESGYTESSDPTDEEVNNFISREVVLKRILSRYVSAIDFTKLSETSLDKLIEFFRKCFKIVWVETESANIKEKVKELDVITEDLEIPSRSGRNIASSLKLHLFS
ncbi:hypothetical protein GLOIN_2v1488591 [Rhizophagus clarus]|uniref:Uncharacterized protein n=1 Tax=Rhizophagus clarus TaxID=94130 RepID=A0A8H3LKV1_9GLOM|nr:hypothetical protein GLOIN_2v1488591 [Rhizophagus clarus]